MSNDPVTEESGLDLFVRLKAPWLFLKIPHCSRVNKILHGGLIKGELTELVGNIAVGKTQLCFSVIANILLVEKDANTFVVFMDTNGSFRSTRLVEILMSNKVPQSQAIEWLSRILVCRVYDDNDLKRALTAVKKREEVISLIVIDSIGAALAQTTINYVEGGFFNYYYELSVSLLFSVYSKFFDFVLLLLEFSKVVQSRLLTGKEIQQEIIALLHLLKRKLGCAVLTTNHFVYWKKYPAPSLGQKWLNAVDSRYLLAKLPDCWYIQLVHSRRFEPTSERAFYKITDRGIHDFADENFTQEETQTAEEIISQNWNTVLQIYSQSVNIP